MFLGLLGDRFGRTARDLRVSLTDRCNLRCSYCMPAEGLAWLPTEATLTDAEVIRLLGVAVERLGITRVRFTGGEPLLRRGLEEIVAAAAALRGPDGRPELALTTNGLGLDRRAAALRAAGLDRVNVSLDSLDPERYAALARRDRLPDVLAGIEAAAAAGLSPVKINAVVMRGANEADVVPLAHFCLDRGYQLRFIEQMPLGPQGEWDRENLVTADEVLGLLRDAFDLSPAVEPRGAAPAELWDATGRDGAPAGRIGVIASVTHPFCGACDRTRLTADGQLRSCLFSRREGDLRSLLRSGASDDELAEAWCAAQWAKPAAHGIDTAGFVPPTRTMSAIGG
ncbi:GTP 3',8-cyclase MoaA [Tessaracoccus palaemonis]|uniref:GTP 3',8-cyclase n=1 Tax=Tessaracoccus palaemonis TaxID=2829499 RepID=A0ABX8SFZ5_9ACTN|nr:GTP 3',8-cyclase MoaA [Tessaracoccus palaemonis]QXT62296.1 GTP 3',8-cyclase MoaA [Tessaracoccus palaemonis]